MSHRQVEKEDKTMAEQPIYFMEVKSVPPAPTRGPKPGSGRVQQALREARREGLDRWIKFPNVCAASFLRCAREDAEFRGVQVRWAKRSDSHKDDVFVLFPSGGAR